jgi:hypothetical protein
MLLCISVEQRRISLLAHRFHLTLTWALAKKEEKQVSVTESTIYFNLCGDATYRKADKK